MDTVLMNAVVGLHSRGKQKVEVTPCLFYVEEWKASDVSFRERVQSEAPPFPLSPARLWAAELAANVNWAQLNFI